MNPQPPHLPQATIAHMLEYKIKEEVQWRFQHEENMKQKAKDEIKAERRTKWITIAKLIPPTAFGMLIEYLRR